MGRWTLTRISGADISEICYRDIYTVNSNQAFLLKSYGGNGLVTDVTLEGFIVHNNSYTFWLDSYWSGQTPGPGVGVHYDRINVHDWVGTCADGVYHNRGPVWVVCPNTTACTNIHFEDFRVWTIIGDEEYHICADAYGEGFCLRPESEAPPVDEHLAETWTTTVTATATPRGWQNAPYMPSDINSPIGVTASIPIPTVPTTFFPGKTPLTSRNYRPKPTCRSKHHN